MPLARIVTRLAEDTDALAQDLRARGFEVVTKSPDEISSEPVDLEITVEECAFEEALTSASAIARTQDKRVFIAPGAITGDPRPVSVLSFIREPELESVPLVETQAIETQPEVIAEDPAIIELEEVSRSEAEAVSETRHQPLFETTPVILQEDVSVVKTEPTSDWPIWHPLAEPEIATQNSPLPKSVVKEPVFAVPLTSRAKPVFNEQLPQVVPLMQNAVPVRPNTYRQKILQKQVLQNDEVFWKTATVLAMVAVAALLVGASVNRFSPLPANVMQRSIEAQQPVPFEKARIVPALPLDAKIGASELPSTRGSDVVGLHPALAVEPASPRIVPESDDRPNDRLVRVKPRSSEPHPPSATHHSAGPAESDMVAEDTVVRYNKRPAAAHTQAQKNAGVKQHSDLD